MATQPQHLRSVDRQLAALWRDQPVRKSAQPPVDGCGTRDLVTDSSSHFRHRRAGTGCRRLLIVHHFPAFATGWVIQISERIGVEFSGFIQDFTLINNGLWRSDPV